MGQLKEKTMLKFIVVLMLISTSTFADEWTTADTYREVAFQTLNVIDWGQTRYIAQNPDRFYEKESQQFIGQHPTTGRVDVYMAETAVMHYAISKALVHYGYHTAADVFQYVTIGSKLNAVVGNISIGVKMSF
jgi:hypothetical protein